MVAVKNVRGFARRIVFYIQSWILFARRFVFYASV